MAILTPDPTQGRQLFEGTQGFLSHDDAADNMAGGAYSHVAIEASATEAEANADWQRYINTILQSGGISIPVYNNTGATITAGTLIYITGYDSANLGFTIAKANVTSIATMAEFVVYSDILNLANGIVYKQVEILNQDTSLGAVGDLVYLSSTPGAFSLTATNQIVGRITAVSATVGKIAYIITSQQSIIRDKGSINFIIDGGGVAIVPGIKGDLTIDFDAIITGVTMLANQSGSIVVDIWKNTYLNYPPLAIDSVTAAAKPTITAAVKSQDATLTGWTTSINAGDILRYNVDSATGIQRLTLSLQITKV